MTEAPVFTDRFTNHVGYESERTSATGASSWIAPRDDLLDDDGRLHPAVLGYLIDSTGGVVCGAAAVPSWVVTADLEYSVVGDARVGPWRADAVAVRPGRRQSLADVRVVDEGAGDALVAVGTVNHLVIAKDDDLDVPTMPVGVRYRPHAPLAPPIAALEEHFGLRVAEGAGTAELDVVGDAVNPLGILHGGLLSLLAVSAARALPGAHRRATEVMLRFVGSLPQDGVARAVAEELPASDGTTLARVTIRDAGDDRQRVGALATVRLSSR